MSSHMLRLRTVRSYIRCMAATRTKTTTPILCRKDLAASKYKKVLIVDFRDEVYASLKACLEEAGHLVGRVDQASEVTPSIIRFAPNLLLINEAFPDESCWLITKKLRLGGQRVPLWVYAARRSPCWDAWKKFSDIDEVIEYGGDLLRLITKIRLHLIKLSANFDCVVSETIVRPELVARVGPPLRSENTVQFRTINKRLTSG